LKSDLYLSVRVKPNLGLLLSEFMKLFSGAGSLTNTAVFDLKDGRIRYYLCTNWH
jgi:hypothetical protein